MLVTSVSFFNEVATETQKLSSKPLFHFLTRLPQRRKNYPRVVSFFNELEIKNHAQRPLFHFLTRLPQRCKNYPHKSRFNPQTSVSFFNEVAAETQKLSSKPLFLIMDSKRTLLWNDTMSRDKTRSWLPRGLHWRVETHSGRTPCRESRQE
jgi:hypothetical protein